MSGDSGAPDAADAAAAREGAEEGAAPASERPATATVEAAAAGAPEEAAVKAEPPAAKAPAVQAAKAPAVEEAGSPRYAAYLALFDFARVPTTRAGWAVRGLAVILTLIVLARRVGNATAPMLRAKAPAPIPTEQVGDVRFQIPEKTRRDIFADLAAAELAERARAIQANTWRGHVWSREDDRGHYERVAARAAAVKYKVSLTQVYLVLDEGLRARWPGPDGKPLPATTPPFAIRSNSW